MDERITNFKYMRSSSHRIVGRADIQMAWLESLNKKFESAVIKEDKTTDKLNFYLSNGSILEGDTLYIMELSRLGMNTKELKNMLTLLREKNIKVVPLRHSISAKDYKKDFMCAEPSEQMELLLEACKIYKEEAFPINRLGRVIIQLDSPEEESLLLAILKRQISRELGMSYFNVGYNVLQRELHRKEAELYAKEDLVKPLTEEVLEIVERQALERGSTKKKIRFSQNENLEICRKQ